MAEPQRRLRQLPRDAAPAPAPAAAPPAPGAQAARAPEVRLEITAQVLNLNPGLYAIEVAPATLDQMVRLDTGLALPCARLDPLPPSGPGRAFVSVLSESSLLLPGSAPSFVRVAGGVAAALLTVYKMVGPMQPPEVRVRLISAPDLDPAVRDEIEPAAASLPLTLLVHIEEHGDLTAQGGQWAVAPGRAGRSFEGFAIMPGGDVPADQLEYQALLGQDWTSPWTAGGDFCGSRQMALPLLGVRVRLRGDAEARYRCQVWGRYAGGEVVQVENGELCRNEAGTPLEGLRVALIARPVPEGGAIASPSAESPAAAGRRPKPGRSRP
jgi:hypothetical protein